MNSKVEKWGSWLDVIGRQIQTMLVKQDVHNTTLNIISRNKALHQHNPFFDHLFHTYISYISVALRRQLKNNKDSISLHGLLYDMSENVDDIPAHRVVTVDPSGDIKALKEASVFIENYVDKRIAHTDKRALHRLPNPKEMDECIHLMKTMHKKYNSVIHGSDVELMPVMYEWTDIFNIPWIQKK